MLQSIVMHFSYLLPASAAIIGTLGYYLSAPFAFWIGVGMSALNIYLCGISGAYKFPILATILAIIGAIFIMPWYVGIGLGLLGDAAFDGFSIIINIIRGKPTFRDLKERIQRSNFLDR